MANTSCREAAHELLGFCLRGEPWPRELLVRLTRDECATELFRVVAEGLADRFDPRLCEVYERVFLEAFRIVDPELNAGRRPCGNPEGLPHKVFVLSRVTLGADVAITSVILDAAKKKFPEARIFFAGDRKGWELFEADSRLEHLAVSYPRNGNIGERLDCWRELRRMTSDGIVIDPDSRLTQLGLLPMGDGHFFNSRACGGDEDSLNALTRRWVLDTFGVEGTAYVAPKPGPRADITVSLGVGGNAAKRIGDPFERELIRALAGSGLSVLVDKGAGGEEAERVERAVAGLPVKLWDGAFAPFADAIAHSKLYVGYDSAGQHVAAACGVPLVSVFAGFPVPRMYFRWRPTGPGRIEVVRVNEPDPAGTLERTLRAMGTLAVL